MVLNLLQDALKLYAPINWCLIYVSVPVLQIHMSSITMLRLSVTPITRIALRTEEENCNNCHIDNVVVITSS